MSGTTPHYGYYAHGSNVHCVRACLNEDALDLIAVGGESRVEVLQRVNGMISQLASMLEISI